MSSIVSLDLNSSGNGGLFRLDDLGCVEDGARIGLISPVARSALVGSVPVSQLGLEGSFAPVVSAFTGSSVVQLEKDEVLADTAVMSAVSALSGDSISQLGQGGGGAAVASSVSSSISLLDNPTQCVEEVFMRPIGLRRWAEEWPPYVCPNEVPPVDMMKMAVLQQSGILPEDPNHLGWLSVQTMLSELSPGYVIVVGAERALFTLLLAPDHCKVLVRDLDCCVVRYMHAMALFFKICNSRADFLNLLGGNVSDIASRINHSSCLSQKQKEFYSENLQAILSEFLSVDQSWRQCKRANADGCISDMSSWEGVNYWEDDRLFNQLRGKILGGCLAISEGNIQDLEVVSSLLSQRGENVVGIDFSNIGEYHELRCAGLIDGSEYLFIRTSLDRVLMNQLERYFVTHWHAEKRQVTGEVRFPRQATIGGEFGFRAPGRERLLF